MKLAVAPKKTAKQQKKAPKARVVKKSSSRKFSTEAAAAAADSTAKKGKKGTNKQLYVGFPEGYVPKPKEQKPAQPIDLTTKIVTKNTGKYRFQKPNEFVGFVAPEGRQDGRVVFFQRGFGFVQHEASKKNLFFHISDFKIGGLKRIFPGQYVSFEFAPGKDKKFVAKTVLPKVQAMLPNAEIPLQNQGVPADVNQV